MLHKIMAGVLLLIAIGGLAQSPVPIKAPANDPEEIYYFNDLKEFSTTDVGGNPVTQDIFKDKEITVIHFWSPDCIDCLQELSKVKEAEQSLPDNVQLLTVITHDGDFWAEEAKMYLDKHGIEARTLMPGDGDLKSAREKLTWIPTTLIVDSYGDLMCEGLVGGVPERWVEKVRELTGEV